ncbi:MAG: TonB-dependent receptor [Candidatus Latescibacteria bacterium]|nr:TonB-dependent receptor [Candidatus Latescibacterota bacterium]
MLNCRLLRLLVAVGCLALMGASATWAASGKITGTVKDVVTGDILPNANIFVVETESGTSTDKKGRFFLLNVAPGIYTLKITYIGYQILTVEEVRVSADLTTNLELNLSSETIEVEEMVIKAERPIIDKNATNAVRIVGAEDLAILPFRGVQEVFNLQPGVVLDEGALHVRGSRSDEIGYYVDGASVRNPVTGNVAVNLIDEALEEIQLQAGGFNAEYGGANAGIILQELRTGSSDWKIGLMSETDNFTSEYEKRFDTYSYGYSNQVITLSGPVAGNKKVRAFIAGQRRVQDFQASYWDGFQIDDLVDSGDRGGRIHWAEDQEGHAIPDSVNLNLRPGNIEHTGEERLDVNGTLLFDLQPFQLRITGLYSKDDDEINPTPIRNMLNTARLPESERVSGLLNVKGTHFLSPNMFYELNVSLYNQDRELFDPVFKDNFMLYNDSTAVAQASADFTSYSANGIAPRNYDLNGFPFARPGTPVWPVDGTSRSSFYGKEEDSYYGVGGSLTRQTEVHEYKIGFDFQRWTSRRYGITLNSVRNAIENTYPQLDAVYDQYYSGAISADGVMDALIAKAETLPEGQGSLDDFAALIRNTSRADHYGFDAFGRQDEGSGLEAPRNPVLGAAFIQDKIEYKDLIVNAGLRWDYFDVDSFRFKDPEAPQRNDTDFTIDLASMVKTRTFNEISPRLGFSFPVSDLTVFHVQYGRFSQMPAMRSMFTGGARLALELGGQNYIRFPTAFDIEPIRTTQYEIGFERQFTEVASFDVTGFYRDVKGQLQLQRQEVGLGAQNANAYNFLQNGDFATTKGLEFVFKLRRINRLRTEFNYTLSDARGTGSTLNSGVSGVENDSNLPTIISPLDFNETHRGNLFLDYRFAQNESNAILRNLGANLLMKFSSGHNFTLVNGSIGQRGPEEGGILASDDPRSRKPSESINISSTPWTFEVDLKMDKGFDLFGTSAQVYLYVQNLFDRENVINVYGRTGNAADDGFLTDSDLSSQIVEASGGLTYRQLYEAVNLANRQHYWFTEGGDILGEPRQLRFGVKLGL